MEGLCFGARSVRTEKLIAGMVQVSGEYPAVPAEGEHASEFPSVPATTPSKGYADTAPHTPGPVTPKPTKAGSEYKPIAA